MFSMHNRIAAHDNIRRPRARPRASPRPPLSVSKRVWDLRWMSAPNPNENPICKYIGLNRHIRGTDQVTISNLTPIPNSAYKLGKKKRSYNQVELTFDKAMIGRTVNLSEKSIDENALNIYEATERSFSIDVPKEMRDSALEYELKLYNGSSVRALIYLVYAEPLSNLTGQRPAIGLNGRALTDDATGNSWLPVTRQRCAKGCAGPILSAIQRFGKQGRTQKGGAGKEPAKPVEGGDKWKDARNLFISIDEASNHVNAVGPNKCKVFRYDSDSVTLKISNNGRKDVSSRFFQVRHE